MEKNNSIVNMQVKYFLGKKEVTIDENSLNAFSSIGYKPIYDKKGGVFKI